MSGLASISSWARRRRNTRADAALVRADEARDRRDWSTAAEQYRLHVLERPQHFAIWVQLGHAEKEVGHLGAALEAYGQALRLDPQDADLLLNLGHIHKLMGHRDSAIFFYRRSAAQDGNSGAIEELVRFGVRQATAPGHHPPHGGPKGSARAGSSSSSKLPLARLLSGQGARRARRAVAAGNDARDRRDWGAAIEQYRLYLAFAPADFAIWVQLGHSLKEAGHLAQSLDAYDEAFRVKGDDADLLLSFGHVHKLRGAFAEAISFYRRSFELDGNRDAREELVALGEFAQASRR